MNISDQESLEAVHEIETHLPLESDPRHIPKLIDEMLLQHLSTYFFC